VAYGEILNANTQPADMTQARCCVVCSRSTPKTIFSCRYKVHQRNIEVLRVFFKRELDFGELCDRCYRLWYKHKRTKKETPTSSKDGQAKTSRKRKSASSVAPSSVDNMDRLAMSTNNDYYNKILDTKSNVSQQCPSIKKFRRQDEQEAESLTYDKIFLPPLPQYLNPPHDDDNKSSQNNATDIPSKNTKSIESEEQKLLRDKQQEEDDFEILQQLGEQEEAGPPSKRKDFSVLSAIRAISQAPRKSRRKRVPLKSPAKVDPIFELATDSHHQLLFASLNNGITTPFDFLYSIPRHLYISTPVSKEVAVQSQVTSTTVTTEPSTSAAPLPPSNLASPTQNGRTST
jgi:hypothetical protein